MAIKIRLFSMLWISGLLLPCSGLVKENLIPEKQFLEIIHNSDRTAEVSIWEENYDQSIPSEPQFNVGPNERQRFVNVLRRAAYDRLVQLGDDVPLEPKSF